MPSLTYQEVLQYSPFVTSIFIETGTFMGETIDNITHFFKTIYSIELNKEFAERAIIKYKENDNINILHGDSSQILPDLCKKIEEPVFFWLDGHWSGGTTARGNKDCPLLEELLAINSNLKSECVIAIDDARLFGTKENEDWKDIVPENILEIVKNRLVNYRFYPSNLHSEDRMILILKSIN